MVLTGITAARDDELGGTGLTGDGYQVGLCLSSSPTVDRSGTEMAVPNHVVQGTSDIPEGALGADRGLDHFGFEVLACLAVLLDRSDEHRSHHAAVIGDGVVEHHDLHRTQFDRIAVRHLTERHGVLRYVDAHFIGARNLAIDTIHQPHFLDSLDEFLRRSFVTAGDDLRQRDVTRYR